MKVLAADTSTSINAVAVCDGDRVLAETMVDCGRAHTERLLDTVDWVLREAGLGIDNVELLAVSIGPGSFTGLRVGVAAWKGLALARELPLVGVPTLDAMTRLGVFHEGRVCPLLDARMGEVFGTVYKFEAGERRKLKPDSVGPVEHFLEGAEGEALFLGNGATLYRERIVQIMPAARFASGACSIPRGAAVAAEAMTLLKQGACLDAARVAPVYLRTAKAEARWDRATTR